jgi:predicted nucleic acid-binding protein
VNVRLIIDTSALLAYLAGDTRSLDVGELLASVEENGDITGIPVACLVAAYKQVGAEQQTRLLELAADDDGPTVILPILAADAAQVAEKALRLDFDRAHAAAEVHKHDATLATYQRKAYGATLEEDDILDL